MHPELAELAKYLLGILVLIVGFLIVRTLKKIDDSQNRLHESQCKLHERFDVFSRDFYKLQGEHDSIKERCLKMADIDKALGRA